MKPFWLISIKLVFSSTSSCSTSLSAKILLPYFLGFSFFFYSFIFAKGQVLTLSQGLTLYPCLLTRSSKKSFSSVLSFSLARCHLCLTRIVSIFYRYQFGTHSPSRKSRHHWLSFVLTSPSISLATYFDPFCSDTL